MKYLLSVMMAAGFFCIAVAAFAQSTAPQAAHLLRHPRLLRRQAPQAPRPAASAPVA